MSHSETIRRSRAIVTRSLGRTAALSFAVLALTAAAGRPVMAGYADPPPIPKTADEVSAMTREQLAKADAALQQIIGVSGTRTVENTLVPYNQMSIHLDLAGAM